MADLKIAIVHDHLLEFGGAERVLVALKKIYPDADVYTAFINWDNLGVHKKLIEHWNIYTSWADYVPFLKRFYSPLRWLGPYIWDSFDFKDYDVVISSSATLMSKGVVTRPHTLHVSYLHHPPRYLYYYETAVEWQKFFLIRVYGHIINMGLRIYDYLSSQRVDYFIANSQETQRRAKKFYRRDSDVIYPPVEIPEDAQHKADEGHHNGENTTSDEKHTPPKKDYYLTISRLARAKHIDILVQAAAENKFYLKVVGSGRDLDHLKSLANEYVEFVGEITDEERNKLFAGAKAFLFASVDEEFGIAPVEALGHSVPVIAYASGGLKETIQDGTNGYLYTELTPDSLYKKVVQLEGLSHVDYATMSKAARESSKQYSFAEFKRQITDYISTKYEELTKNA